jgi:rhodanese-related sulfurtransferase
MDVSNVSPVELQRELDSTASPVLVDVRAQANFLEADSFIAGALRRRPDEEDEWTESLPKDRPIVVYCVKGGDVGESSARCLASDGRAARFLAGGVRGWAESGGMTLPKPIGGSTLWVTRERPKIDRIACPWLITRFIDREAEFRYVKAGDVVEIARKERGIPFDIPDTLFSHEGELCTSDRSRRRHRTAGPRPGVRGAPRGLARPFTPPPRRSRDASRWPRVV